MIPKALTIAASDSGGGAGIQADLKSFSAMGVYGASVLTALTAQNTRRITAIHDIPADFVKSQMNAVFEDITINSVKIGMLYRPSIIMTVAESLKSYHSGDIVLDPVMIAKSGDILLPEEAIGSLVNDLFPQATLVTPNLYEAAHLLDEEIAIDDDSIERQATAIIDMGPQSVLIKGGHAQTEEAKDFLLTANGKSVWYSSPFIFNQNTHGTGCSLSSAIAARLAHGDGLEDAIFSSKAWLSQAIQHSKKLDVGLGSGPVHHFHHLWPQEG
ncbi:bifunctional hydroxymethylpyrimidine kinase/phosphomethylpyrimidine kinase [Candidatus Endowatersipora endosymbiont of Watersipora subatra]|uniref:bifunctional hydroxymethylpyrimidine kinase/phosphomethylpyrimidine kinase n=1 Tax=Candidatus Endowatersipora endosymbiont of Watersipora subatra TaxID=3077946 RepID=UPI00312CA876